MATPNGSRPKTTSKTAKSAGQFYETMPLMAMPHSIYRDDVVETGSETDAAVRAYSQTAVVTLIVTIVTIAVFMALVMYGLSLLDSPTAPANLASGSLDL